MNTKCPNCKQEYDVDDELIGQKAQCEHCGKTFIIESEPIRVAETRVVKTNVRQGASIGAIICLVIAFLLNIASNFLFFIWGPLYLAAFILSIVAMAQRRIVSGLIVLILSLVLPVPIILMNIASGAKAIDSAIKQQEQRKPQENEVPRQTPPPEQEQTAAKASDISKKASPKHVISGLMGMNLGNIFHPKDSPDNGKLQSGETLYAFSPAKKFREFDEYYVLITPVTHKIYQIWIRKAFKNSAKAHDEQKICLDIMKDRFKPKEVKDELFSLDSGKVMSFDNGEIYSKVIIGFGENTLEFRCVDNELSKLAEKEKISSEKSKTDSSML